MRITIIGGNGLMTTLYNQIAEVHNVTVINNAFIPNLSPKISQITVPATWRRTDMVLRKIGSQISLPYYLPKGQKVLKSTNPDVIYVLEFTKLWSIQAVMYAKKHKHCKLIVLSETKKYPSNKLSRAIFEAFAKYTKVRSKYITDIISLAYGGQHFMERYLHLQNIRTCTLPISHQEIPATKASPAHTPLRVLVPARFVPYKNHTKVIEALDKIKDKHSIEIHFRDFINERRYNYTALVDRVANREPNSTKILLGDPIDFSNILTEFKNYDVILLPSESEAFGIVVPLALFAGCVTITSSTVGANLYVLENITGLIYPAENIDSLAEALTSLSSNPNKVLEMKLASLEHARSFNVKTLTEDFLKPLSK